MGFVDQIENLCWQYHREDNIITTAAWCGNIIIHTHRSKYDVISQLRFASTFPSFLNKGPLTKRFKNLSDMSLISHFSILKYQNISTLRHPEMAKSRNKNFEFEDVTFWILVVFVFSLRMNELIRVCFYQLSVNHSIFPLHFVYRSL